MVTGQVGENTVRKMISAGMSAMCSAAGTVPADEPAETLVWLATGPSDAAGARLWTESEKPLAELGF